MAHTSISTHPVTENTVSDTEFENMEIPAEAIEEVEEYLNNMSKLDNKYRVIAQRNERKFKECKVQKDKFIEQ